MNKLQLFIIFALCFGTTFAKAESELEVPELRYTCKQNQAIEIHLSQYAEATGVMDIWSGQTVPYERTFSMKNGDPIEGKPLLLKCALWSGIYTISIGATWSSEKFISGVSPTVKVERDGKEVLPTTVLGECETKNPNFGDCNSSWGVRIFIFESIDRIVDGKPVGIYVGVNVNRITKDAVSYEKIR
jgi:hypothetical protein